MTSNAHQASINSSPEFEFSTTLTNNDLLSADQLFSHGQILPLDHHAAITHHDSPPDSSTASTFPNLSPNFNPKPKKWKKLFTSHHTTKSNVANVANGTASQYSHNAISQHELNIHIWPFSRSRSSGNTNSNGGSTGLGRSRSIRKSISAPCSRNNSQGHDAASSSKINGKKWGSLTGGIHVGRNMPVFQLKRKKTTANTNIDNAAGHLQVNGVDCCRAERDKGSVVNGGGDQNTVTGDKTSMFNLRSIFSKKPVY